MKKFNKKIVTTLVIASFMFGFVGLNSAQAATSPDLGAATSFSVLAQTLITGIANISGNVGMNNTYDKITALTTAMVSPGLIYSTTTGGQSEGIIDPNVQANAATAYGALTAGANADANCIGGILTDATELTTLSQPLAPGLYCSAGSFMLTGHLTLAGTTGTWVFKTVSGITTAPNSSVTGGDPCNVWWRIGSAASELGTGTSFIGTIIANTGIHFGTGVTLNGRALAIGADVTLNSSGATILGPTCGAPTTLNVIKHVSGGTASAGDWTLTVASTNSGSGTGSAAGSAGTLYTLQAGKAYSVTENAGPSGYTPSLSGCTIASAVAGTTYTCTITNTFVPVIRNTSSGSSVMPIFNPTINIISTPIIPKLPKTGFPPQTWYGSLLNSFLNLFR